MRKIADSVGEIGLDLVVNEGGFQQQMQGLKKTASKAGDGLASSFSGSKNAMSGLSSTAKKLGGIIAGAFAVGQIAKFGKECLGLGSDLAEVQNVVDVTFPTMSSQIDSFAKNAASSFGLSETMAKKFTGTFGSMAEAFGFSEKAAADMATTLTGLAGDVASFYNLSQDEAYTKLKSVFTGETESLKDLGVVMTQSALDAFAMANGFGKTTSAMTEAEKVSLRYAFVQQQLANAQGDFARTSGGWANQVRILKLQFDSLKATLGQGFINLFTPIIKCLNALISRLSVAAAKFKMFTELITGNKSSATSGLTDAATNASDTEDAIGGAADAADTLTDNTKKAAKAAKQLMGFDKITKLSDTSSSSSSNASTDTSSPSGLTDSFTTSVDNIFADADVDRQMEEFVKKIKEAFNKGDFTDIGALTGKKLNEALKGMDWTNIKETTNKIAKSIATFLNGFLEKTDWDNVGKTIAEGINTAVLGIDNFLTTFHWDSAAKAVAGTINGFLKNVDWKTAGKTIADGINGVVDYITTLVKEIDWKSVATAIKDTLSGFCENIEWGSLAKVIGVALGLKLAKLGAHIGIEAIKSKFGEWVKGTLVKGLKDKLAGGVAKGGLETAAGTAVEGAVGTGVKTAGASTKLLATVGKFAAAIGGCLAAAIGGWTVGKWIYEAVTGEDTSNLDWSSLKCFSEYPAAFKAMGQDIAKWWDVNITVPLSDTVGRWAEGFESDKEKIKSALSGIGTFFSEKYADIVSTFSSIPEKFTAWFTAAYSNTTSAFSGWKSWFRGKYDGVVDVFKGIPDKFTTWFSRSYSNATSAFSGIKGWFKGKYDGIVNTFSGLPEKFTTWFSTAYSNAKENIKGLPGYVAALKNKIGDKFKNFGSNVGKAFGNAVISAVNKMIDITQKQINGAIKLLNGAINLIKKLPGCGKLGSIGDVKLPKIDYFAQGGYVQANTPRLAVIGDNKHEGEYVAPESKLMAMAQQAAALSNSSGMTSQVVDVLLQILQELKTMNLEFYLDGEKVTKKITAIINNHTRANGGRCEII